MNLAVPASAIKVTWCPMPIVSAHPTVARIQAEVARFYGIELFEMLSTRRARTVTRPRQLAMFLARELTPLSLPLIGRLFKRDHSTVCHAINVIEALLFDDDLLRQDIAFLKVRIA